MLLFHASIVSGLVFIVRESFQSLGLIPGWVMLLMIFLAATCNDDGFLELTVRGVVTLLEKLEAVGWPAARRLDLCRL